MRHFVAPEEWCLQVPAFPWQQGLEPVEKLALQLAVTQMLLLLLFFRVGGVGRRPDAASRRQA